MNDHTQHTDEIPFRPLDYTSANIQRCCDCGEDVVLGRKENNTLVALCACKQQAIYVRDKTPEEWE